MKKLTVFILLTALLLAGCGSRTASPEAAENATDNVALHPIAEQLPTLTIHQDNTALEAHIGSYNWQVDNGDGTSTGVCVDAVHPLDIADSLPLLEAESLEVQLEFSETPESILVWCWEKTEEDAQMLTAEENALWLLPGTHVYQITATWLGHDGFENIVHYSFCAAVPTEAVQ